MATRLRNIWEKNSYGRSFRDHYLFPMGSAIWSSPLSKLGEFPARAYLRFFDNHGLLTLKDRPQWRYVRGGSQTYMRKMVGQLKKPPVVNADIAGIQRHEDGATIHFRDGHQERF